MQADLLNLYNNTWATKPQRLTALINELKRMGAVTQLDPNSMSFSQVQDSQSQKTGGVGTSTVTITFTVQGTYQQIRRLINLLELSGQFVIIDAIYLSGSGEPNANLTLNLRLKTLFRELPRTPPVVNDVTRRPSRTGPAPPGTAECRSRVQCQLVKTLPAA